MLAGFLCDVPGVSPARAAEDACRMDHVLSQETLEKLRAFIDRRRP